MQVQADLAVHCRNVAGQAGDFKVAGQFRGLILFRFRIEKTDGRPVRYAYSSYRPQGNALISAEFLECATTFSPRSMLRIYSFPNFLKIMMPIHRGDKNFFFHGASI